MMDWIIKIFGIVFFSPIQDSVDADSRAGAVI